jgi:ribosomal protein S16
MWRIKHWLTGRHYVKLSKERYYYRVVMLDVTPDNIMTNISIYEPFVLVDGQYHKLRKDMVYKWLT